MNSYLSIIKKKVMSKLAQASRNDPEVNKSVAAALTVVREEQEKASAAREAAQKKFTERADSGLQAIRSLLEDTSKECGIEEVIDAYAALRDFEDRLRSLSFTVGRMAAEDAQ